MNISSFGGDKHEFYLVVVISSPHQSPRCCVWRVEKVWKFWLPTMSAGNPAAKRRLSCCDCPRRCIGQRSGFVIRR